jgi:hypothetical protein
MTPSWVDLVAQVILRGELVFGTPVTPNGTHRILLSLYAPVPMEEAPAGADCERGADTMEEEDEEDA